MDRMCGPFYSSPLDNLMVSSLGVVPKKEPNKFCLIFLFLKAVQLITPLILRRVQCLIPRLMLPCFGYSTTVRLPLWLKPISNLLFGYYRFTRAAFTF